MQARPIDGAEGYALFLSRNGEIELDEINEYLRGIGLREVAPRMLSHYRKLRRHGYSRYITQNRLDLAISGEPAWTEEMRAQYPELRKDVAAVIVDGWEIRDVQVERLGAVSAAVLDPHPPSAGRIVVLRLLATGIERVGTVARSDPVSGRFHLNFDTYTSLPIAAVDSPYKAVVRFDLNHSAENLVALSDLLLHLEQSLTRIDRSGVQVVRVSRMRLSSPLEMLIVGQTSVAVFVAIAKALANIRLTWYQGTKTKYETEGIRIDNDIKRRSVQQNADRNFMKALEKEYGSTDTPMLDELSQTDDQKGQPNSLTRRQFLEVIGALIHLPTQMSVRMLDDRDT